MMYREMDMYSPEWWEKISGVAEAIAWSADVVFEESVNMRESMQEFKWSKMYPSSHMLCALFRIANELKEVEIEELKRMFCIEWENMYDEERIENWKSREEE